MNKEIEALLEERRGYVARNLPARVKAVDEVLRGLGYENKNTPKETATAEPSEERAMIAPAPKRKKV